MKKYLAAIIIICSLGFSCAEKHYSDPLTPEEALTRFELSDDFNIEIFAAEPLVTDPVELTFDESGNAYVVEMPDYPVRPPNGAGTGRIKIISDTDGDGRADSSTIFADSMLEVSSVLSWDNGLIVAAAPNIFYMKDTNGDKRADIKQLLFTGFFHNNPEYQVNNLRFGIDNWIYAANFGQAGTITSGKASDTSSLQVERGDFRFRMDDGRFEAAAGRAQFGHALDVWGNRFTSENSIHIAQPVIPWRYTTRHPWLPTLDPVVSITDHEELMFQQTQAPYWRKERTKQRNEVFKEQKVNRTEYADDHFTGACGTTMYAGDLFPGEYYGNIFTNDVAGSLVHRDIISYDNDSIAFTAGRSKNEKAKEFLSSTDPWFRPVNLVTGPDGALYVVDMYRQHVEGPDFIPEDLKKDMDFLNGKEQGRIYRISPKKPTRLQTKPNLRQLPTNALVQLLGHRNQWWRLQAQRLILERQDKSIVPALKIFFTENEDAAVRLHALYALDGLQSINASLVRQAMNDKHPAVRKAGVAMSERYPENISLLQKATGDSSAQVAFQAVLSIGEFPSHQAIPALTEAIKKYGGNKWFRTAVLSSVPGSSMEFLEFLFNEKYFSGGSKEPAFSFLKDFSFIIKKRNRNGEVNRLTELLNAAGLAQ